MDFKVINVDCNGKLIPDISKVVLPLDLSIELLNAMREMRDKSETTGVEQRSPRI